MDLNQLPNNLDAERKVLGAMLRDKSAIVKSRDVFIGFNDDVFYQPSHRMIYHTIIELFESGSTVNIETVGVRLENEGILETVGGAFILGEILNSVTNSATVEIHAQIVLERYYRRLLIRTAAELQLDAIGSEEPETIIHKTIQSLSRLVHQNNHNTIHIEKLLQNEIDRVQSVVESNHTGNRVFGDIKTGFDGIDMMLGGLDRGNLVVLAARPSVGKTILAHNIAEHVAKEKNVLFFTIEMTNEEITRRIHFGAAGISSQEVKQGLITKKDAANLMSYGSKIADLNLYLNDESNIVEKILARAESFHEKIGNTGLIVVDYIQLLRSTKRNSTRNDELEEISRGFKILANKLNCAVLLLSQLNRESVKSIDKNTLDPDRLLTGLRSSGAIEQDADMVWFLWRTGYDEPGNPAPREFIIGKNRNGSLGNISLQLDIKHMRFQEIQQDVNDLF